MTEQNPNPQPNPDDQNEPEKKYTQDDFNKGMANKEQEVERKFQEQFADKKVLDPDEWQKALDSAAQKGAERAKMSADEKAKADKAEQEQRYKDMQAEFDAMKAERAQEKALSATKDSLASAGLPTDFAEYLTDTDADQRDAKIAKFNKLYTDAIEAGVNERLKGKSNPQTGKPAGPSNSTSKTPQKVDATKMSIEEYMAAMAEQNK